MDWLVCFLELEGHIGMGEWVDVPYPEVVREFLEADISSRDAIEKWMLNTLGNEEEVLLKAKEIEKYKRIPEIKKALDVKTHELRMGILKHFGNAHGL